MPSSSVLLHIYSPCFSDFGTAISTSFNILMKCFYYTCIIIDTTDFIPYSTTDQTVTATNDIVIQLFSRNDAITLEYDDTVILRFIVNPGLAGLIQQLRDVGEYIRDFAIVDIIDSDRKCVLLAKFSYTHTTIHMCRNAHLNAIFVPTVHCTELEINFQESYYVFNEGDQQGSIILRLREAQNSFNMTLYPVTITEARDPAGFNVSAFIASVPTDAEATRGKDV